MSKPTHPTEGANPEAIRHAIILEVGQRLKQTRNQQNTSLEEVSEQLKLRITQLQALECGDWSAISNETFALGFLRQYATLLHIDIEDSLRTLKSDQFKFQNPLTFPDPEIAPSRRWAWIFGIIFASLLVGWNFINHQASTSKNIPVVTPNIIHKTAQVVTPEPTNTPIATPTAPQTNTSKASTPEAHAANPPTMPQIPVRVTPPVLVKMPTPVPVRHAQHSPSKTTPSKASPPISHATASKNAQSKPTTNRRTPTPVPPHHHLYRFIAGAKEHVWLRLDRVLPNGKRQRNDLILRPSHSIEVTLNAPSLRFSCGNAGGLKIEVDGITRFNFGQLGGRGVVIHNRLLRAVRPTGKTATKGNP
ncbi:MAG: helix-turn-helix domain-containing protein [Mariprofundales bacterium]|nr:helix-turn-helix domain-containing protein [Mariprofundales bacterium]